MKNYSSRRDIGPGIGFIEKAEKNVENYTWSSLSWTRAQLSNWKYYFYFHIFVIEKTKDKFKRHTIQTLKIQTIDCKQVKIFFKRL